MITKIHDSQQWYHFFFPFYFILFFWEIKTKGVAWGVGNSQMDHLIISACGSVFRILGPRRMAGNQSSVTSPTTWILTRGTFSCFRSDISGRWRVTRRIQTGSRVSWLAVSYLGSCKSLTVDRFLPLYTWEGGLHRCYLLVTCFSRVQKARVYNKSSITGFGLRFCGY